MRVADHVHRLLGGVFVFLLALVVLLVDAGADLHGLVLVLHDKEADGLLGASDAAGGVDARADVKH